MALKSIAIIPDGTRRWSKREGINLLDGYRHAFNKLVGHIEALLQRGVQDIHIYMFSIYNLKRKRGEIIACLDAECEFIECLLSRDMAVCIIGDISEISDIHPGIAKVINAIYPHQHDKTSQPAIYLYIGYSFNHYIGTLLNSEVSTTAAIDKLAKGKIDLVIRTGGAKTLSDFLPIESRYAQLCFLPTFFNDFSKADLKAICDQYDADSINYKYGE